MTRISQLIVGVQGPRGCQQIEYILNERISQVGGLESGECCIAFDAQFDG